MPLVGTFLDTFNNLGLSPEEQGKPVDDDKEDKDDSGSGLRRRRSRKI